MRSSTSARPFAARSPNDVVPSDVASGRWNGDSAGERQELGRSRENGALPFEAKGHVVALVEPQGVAAGAYARQDAGRRASS
jgi:hypothetical protein